MGDGFEQWHKEKSAHTAGQDGNGEFFVVPAHFIADACVVGVQLFHRFAFYVAGGDKGWDYDRHYGGYDQVGNQVDR